MNDIIVIGYCWKSQQNGAVYSVEGVSPCLTCGCHGGYNQRLLSMLKIRQATKKGYIEVCQGGVFDIAYPNSLTRRGRVIEGGMICPTITCNSVIVLYESDTD